MTSVMDFSSLIKQLNDYSLANNSGYNYMLAALVFIVLLVVLKIVKMLIVGRLRKLAKKTKTDLDDTLIEIFSKVKPPFYFFIALFFSLRILELPTVAREGIKVFFIIAIVYEVIRGLEKLSDYFVSKYVAKAQTDKQAGQSMVSSVNMIIRFVLWVLGIVLILANLGINVTSLVASLGIGGIAIALAAQSILGDIFSSFSIFIDKPFQVGDFIVIGKDKGTVEKIGLKTTRIRTSQGQELIISNNELTSTRVENYKKMEKRRVVFELGVIYETKADTLEKIPTMIEEVVKGIKDAEFSRCHFKSYGDSSLNFEVVYHVNSAEYADYMDVNQKVNLEIFKRFIKEKIDFAYPTRTVYLQK